MARAIVPCSFFHFNSRSVVPKHPAWLLDYQCDVRQTNSRKFRGLLHFFVLLCHKTARDSGSCGDFVCLPFFFFFLKYYLVLLAIKKIVNTDKSAR